MSRKKRSWLKSTRQNLKHAMRLMTGVARFSFTGKTPPAAYQSLIQLYCETGGRSNDLLHALVSAARRPYRFPSHDGVLGKLSQSEADQYAARIRDEGYCVFPHKLPEEMCDRLTEFALTRPAIPRPRRDALPEQLIYDRQNPQAEGLHFSEESLANDPDFQELMSDLSLLSVAQAYHRSQPVLSQMSMWWSTAARISANAKSELAQQYHFDMHRIKWLKVFIYLTDVTENNGPHCFVVNSHRSGHPTHQLLDRGYVRIPDEDIRAVASSKEEVEITGSRGTIIAVDTRGFHKGKALESGDRLIVELDYADSLFGGAFNETVVEDIHCERLDSLMKSYPRIYSRFEQVERQDKEASRKAA